MNRLEAKTAGSNLIVANGNEPLTMSSLEIADLVQKRHDDVKRSIKRLADRGTIELPPMAEHQIETSHGRKHTSAVFLLQKRDCYIVVAQLSPEFTARLVDRWQELEEAAKVPALPNFADPVAAARAWADQMERATTAEAKVIEYAPKAEAYDILDASEGAVTIREAAKLLNAPERKFVRWLQAHDWAFRQNGVGPLQGYAEKRNRGYLEHRPHTYHDAGRGEDRTVAQLMVTPKGLARLAQVFAKQGLPS